MKRLFTLILFTCLPLLVIVVRAQTVDDVWQSTDGLNDRYLLGYTSDTLLTTWSGDVDIFVTWEVAIKLPASMLKQYKGDRIDAVRFGMRENAPNCVEVWVAEELDLTKMDAYRSLRSDAKEGWNILSLETPYVITGDKDVYVGCRIYLSPGMGGPVHSTNRAKLPEAWIFFDHLYPQEGWQNDYQDRPMWAVQAVLGGNDAHFGQRARMTDMERKSFTLKDRDYPLWLKVKNVGVDTIRSLGVEYIVGDATPKVYDATDLKVDVRHVSPRIPIPGIVCQKDETIKYRIKTVNGKPNQENPDYTSLALKVYTDDQATDRLSVIEQFSTERCPSCPGMSARLAAVYYPDYESRMAWVTHHVGSGVDRYTLEASKDYLVFFLGSPFAPALMVDRTRSGYLDYKGKSPIGSGDAVLPQRVKPLFDHYLSSPAFARIAISKPKIDPTTHQATFTVSGKLLEMLPEGNYNLTVFLTEDDLDGSGQLGVPGGYTYRHDHVLRAELTERLGSPINLQADRTFAYDANVRIDASWNVSKMRVVAFVNKPIEPTRVWNAQVINAAQARLDGSDIGIKPVSVTDACTVSVTHGRVVVSGSYTSYQIYDMQGCILGCDELLPSGVYLVRILSGQGTLVTKVLIP